MSSTIPFCDLAANHRYRRLTGCSLQTTFSGFGRDSSQALPSDLFGRTQEALTCGDFATMMTVGNPLTWNSPATEWSQFAIWQTHGSCGSELSIVNSHNPLPVVPLSSARYPAYSPAHEVISTTRNGKRFSISDASSKPVGHVKLMTQFPSSGESAIARLHLTSRPSQAPRRYHRPGCSTRSIPDPPIANQPNRTRHLTLAQCRLVPYPEIRSNAKLIDAARAVLRISTSRFRPIHRRIQLEYRLGFANVQHRATSESPSSAVHLFPQS